jgi:hypothetical protein
VYFFLSLLWEDCYIRFEKYIRTLLRPPPGLSVTDPEFISSSQLSFLTLRGMEPRGHDTLGGAAGATRATFSIVLGPPIPAPLRLPVTI